MRSSSTAAPGKAGIKPLLGCEIYLVDDRRARAHSTQRDWNHLTLLAETTEGYHNLIKLCTLGYLEGYYYKPRVDYALLEQYAGGIIALSGCLSGRTCSALLAGDTARARARSSTAWCRSSAARTSTSSCRTRGSTSTGPSTPG